MAQRVTGDDDATLSRPDEFWPDDRCKLLVSLVEVIVDLVVTDLVFGARSRSPEHAEARGRRHEPNSRSLLLILLLINSPPTQSVTWSAKHGRRAAITSDSAFRFAHSIIRELSNKSIYALLPTKMSNYFARSTSEFSQSTSC